MQATSPLLTLVVALSLTVAGRGLQEHQDPGAPKAKGVPAKLEITQLSGPTEVIQSLSRQSGWEMRSSFLEAPDSGDPNGA